MMSLLSCHAHAVIDLLECIWKLVHVMTISKCAELAMEGKEYHVFQKHHHELCASISNNVKSFADIAQEKGLISGADAQRVTDMLSSDLCEGFRAVINPRNN